MNSLQPFLGKVTQGDCIHVLRRFPDQCIDLVVTDPPYLVRYEDRDGRKIANDDNPHWLFPAFAEIYRVLKPDRYCVSFYGWGRIEKFLLVWKELGLFPVGHFVFIKPYASRTGHTRMCHEQAYLLAKGRPQPPAKPPPDVIGFEFSGNGLHPTQKPLTALTPLIGAYSGPDDIVLDPFAGSGSTGIAARESSRRFVLIEKDPAYARLAQERLSGSRPPLSSTRR